MGIQLRHIDEPGRNDPCVCGSKLKYKYCHGDGMKRIICNNAANEMMKHLVFAEQIKKGLKCIHGVWKTEFCKDCKVGD